MRISQTIFRNLKDFGLSSKGIIHLNSLNALKKRYVIYPKASIRVMLITTVTLSTTSVEQVTFITNNPINQTHIYLEYRIRKRK